ncbi:unnamed protein product [Knipowitschia caucasica]|uniref:Chemokine interleukin-8-like domain-containing protein n=1 Tax=Knipowitschia caucasica TaxID=637954 RepID=A0AAV2L806_KNICA
MVSLLPWIVLAFAAVLSPAGMWPVQSVCSCSQGQIQQRNDRRDPISPLAKCFEEKPPHCSNHAFKIKSNNGNRKRCFKPEAPQIRAFIKAGGVCRPSVTSV